MDDLQKQPIYSNLWTRRKFTFKRHKKFFLDGWYQMIDETLN